MCLSVHSVVVVFFVVVVVCLNPVSHILSSVFLIGSVGFLCMNHSEYTSV